MLDETIQQILKIWSVISNYKTIQNENETNNLQMEDSEDEFEQELKLSSLEVVNHSNIGHNQAFEKQISEFLMRPGDGKSYKSTLYLGPA